MHVPFLDLKAQYCGIKADIDKAIRDVINKSAFIGGEFVVEFEENFRKYTNSQLCLSVASGTDALVLALKASGIEKGDRVSIFLPQCPETAIAHIAVYKIGAIANPLSVLLGPEALKYRLSNSQAKAIITKTS